MFELAKVAVITPNIRSKENEKEGVAAAVNILKSQLTK